MHSTFLLTAVLLGSGSPSVAQCIQDQRSSEQVQVATQASSGEKQEVSKPKIQSVTLLVRGMMKSRSGAT